MNTTKSYIVYANLTSHGVITSLIARGVADFNKYNNHLRRSRVRLFAFIARGEAEFNKSCNRKEFLQLDYCIMTRSSDIITIIVHGK